MGVGYVQGDRTYVLRTDVGTYDVRIVEGSVVPPQPCESCGSVVIPVMIRDRSDLNDTAHTDTPLLREVPA